MDALPVSGMFFQPLIYLFFVILIYEFLLEMQKFKVILSSKKFSATKMEAIQENSPPKLQRFSCFKHPPGLRVDDPMRGA